MNKRDSAFFSVNRFYRSGDVTGCSHAKVTNWIWADVVTNNSATNFVNKHDLISQHLFRNGKSGVKPSCALRVWRWSSFLFGSGHFTIIGLQTARPLIFFRVRVFFAMQIFVVLVCVPSVTKFECNKISPMYERLFAVGDEILAVWSFFVYFVYRTEATEAL